MTQSPNKIDKAMILAAGRGERMMPLTASTPKPLLEVGEKPLLSFHIERLKQAGLTDLVINHSYLGDKIEDYYQCGNSHGVTISWSRESSPLETAGGIIKALPLLGDQPFWVINGDVWCDLNYQDLLVQTNIDTLFSGEILAHLILVPNPAHNPKGDFGLHDNLVVNKAEQMYTFSGISILSPKLFKDQLAGKPLALAPILRKACDNDQVSGQIYDGDWQDIGTPQRLENLRQQYKKQSTF